MTSELKICFATDGIFPHAIGGMQRHSRLLIEELSKNPSVKIHVIHPHPGIRIFPGISNITEYCAGEIRVSENYILESWDYSKRIYEITKSIEYDVLYSQGICIWKNINAVKKKLIVNLHGLEPFQAIGWKNKLIAIPFKIIFSRVLRKARYVISEGGILTDILKEIVSPDKIIFLPNATNIPSGSENFIRKFSPRKINILFVGRFAGNKGIHILMEVIKQLNNDGFTDKITFNLGGKGPLFDFYSRKFLFPNVNYLGFVPDENLPELYKNNDLFVLPTLFEGMPTVILEAMSWKMPVISTNTGAISELVDPSNGKRIQKNSVNELKEAILEFFGQDNFEKEKKSRASYEKVKNGFTWPIIAKKHLELFFNVSSGSNNSILL